MLADLRLALRALRRAPGFAAAAILCLGIGLGANALVYAVVEALVLRPLPYHAPDRMVTVATSDPGDGDGTLSRGELLALRERTRALTGLAGYVAAPVSLAGPAGAHVVTAARVSAELFTVLGAAPLVGRAFHPDESRPGAAAVAVLSEPLWRERFDADPRTIGSTVLIDGRPATVVGVMPARMGVTGDREQLWVPLEHPRGGADAGPAVTAVGRLAPGATIDQARAELAALARNLPTGSQPRAERPILRVDPLADARLPAEIGQTVAAAFGAVGLVLLVACANVASLLLARARGRARELATRAALGAPRARLVRLLALETALVALPGAALGLALARAGLGALVASIPVVYPAWVAFTVDARVAAYAVGLALAAGLVLGVATARRATGASLARAVRGVDGGSPARSRRALVAGQLALTVVLLAGAGLLVRSVLGLQRGDLGFEPRGVLALTVFAPGDRYARPASRRALAAQLRDRLGALPGVDGVAAAAFAPLSGSSWGARVAPPSASPADTARRTRVQLRAVNDGYFTVVQQPLVAGRAFTAAESADSADGPVVINETLARRMWAGATPVGERLVVDDGDGARPRTVVGVVRDARETPLARGPQPAVYVPLGPVVGRRVTYLLRARCDAGPARCDAAAAAPAAPAARAAVRAADPALAVADVEPLVAIARQSLWQPRLFGRLFAGFAAAALGLALVGVYGLVAYAVAERTRELGVRAALGARPADLYRAVLGAEARAAGVGVAAGAVLALGLTQALAAALPNVSPRDPTVLAAAVAALLLAAGAAAWAPARRAARLDPREALRAE